MDIAYDVECMSSDLLEMTMHSEDVGTVAADTRNKDLAADMRNWGKGRG